MKIASAKIALSTIAALLLASCAATYTLEGKKYASKEKFQTAVDSKHASAINNVIPLPKPITAKKLIFGLPGEAVMQAESIKRFIAQKGTPPVGNAKEIIENLTRFNYKDLKVFYFAVERKNIYSTVQFIDMDSMNASIEPSYNTDVIYFVEPSPGSAQWFFSSLKHGRQIFASDRSLPGVNGKISGFLDALQAQAIRD